MTIIKAEHLSKSYEYYRKQPGMLATVVNFFRRETLFAEAVKDISFSINEGELVGFLGPNGAGKTTTLKMLSGIIEPSAGSLEVLGHLPARREVPFQRMFSLVMGQKNQLIRQLPAADSFLLNKALYGLPDNEYKEHLQELVDVFDAKDILDIQVRKLSLGQRMKCEIIASLIHKPKLLLLDEPTIGLDVVAQKSIRDFIKRYNEEKKTTIILTSHYMQDIRELCKRVIIINLGQIMYDGSLEKLIDKYAPHKVLRLTFGREVMPEALKQYGDIDSYESHSASIKVLRNEAKSTAAKLLTSTLDISDIMIDEENIDDIIRQIFKRGNQAI